MSHADSAILQLTDRLKDKYSWFRVLERNQPLILTILLIVFLLRSWLTGLPFNTSNRDVIHILYEFPLKIIRYAAYLFCLLAIGMNFLLGRYRFWNFAVISFTAAITFLVCQSPDFCVWFLLILAEAPADFRRTLKVYALCQGFVLLFVPLMAAFGILSNVLFDSERLRQGLGFGWTTTAPMLFFFFILISCRIQNAKMSDLTVFLFALSPVWLYFLTNTRMVFLCSLLFLILIFTMNRKPHWFAFTEKRWFYYFLILLPLLLTVVAFTFVYSYSEGNTALSFLNTLLSDRLDLTQKALETYGIHLFGHRIIWIGYSTEMPEVAQYNYVDISYMNILLNYGVVVLISVVYFYSRLLALSWKQKDRVLMIIIVFILVLSLSEVRLVNPLYNPFILLFGNFALKHKYQTGLFRSAIRDTQSLPENPA